MAQNFAELQQRAAHCRAAAASALLENVRQVHLKAAARWETLADRELWKVGVAAEQVVACAGPSRSDAASSSLSVACSVTEEQVVAEHLAEPSVEPEPEPSPVGESSTGRMVLYGDDGNLRTLDEIEADVIRLAMQYYRGSISEAARRLGIGRSTLYRKLDVLGIEHAA